MNAASSRRLWLMFTVIPRAPRKIDAAGIEKHLREHGIVRSRRTIQRDLMAMSAHIPLVRDNCGKPFGWSWAEDAPLFGGPR